jgi:hypothetical protein
MIKLTSLLKEIRVMPVGGYSRVLDEYIKSVLTQEEHYQDDPEAIEYFTSLKQNPPKASSAEETAKKIEEIDDTLTELSGAYIGEFYSEAVFEPLVQIGKKVPSLKIFIKQVIEILHELYNEDKEDIKYYNEHMAEQWREDRLYQDILDLYIDDNIFGANRLLHLFHSIQGYGEEMSKFANALKLNTPTVDSPEELVRNINSINSTMIKLKPSGKSYVDAKTTLEQMASEHPRLRSIIEKDVLPFITK